MLIGSPPECPQCQCPVNREHFSTLEHGNHRDMITHLYCEFCNTGWETLWGRSAGGWIEKFTCIWNGADRPVELGKFLKNLENARAA